MTPYLMSSQTVFDIVRNQGLPAEKWLQTASKRGLFEENIFISSVTPMTVLHTIDVQIAIAIKSKSAVEPTTASLGVMKNNALRFLAGFRSNQQIVPMDDVMATRWGELLDMNLSFTDNDGVVYSVGSSEKIELAIASAGRDGHPFVYVDRAQVSHTVIPNLVVECPHAKMSVS